MIRQYRGITDLEKVRIINRILDNPVYECNNGLVVGLRDILRRLPLNALQNLDLIIGLKTPKERSDEAANLGQG